MKRWTILVVILCLAAGLAAIASRELQRRREGYDERVLRVRTGMTFEEAFAVMEGFHIDAEDAPFDTDGLLSNELGYVKWGGVRPPDKRESIEIRIYFDKRNCVTRRTMGGQQLPDK
jgi:hypothetical protein